MTKHVPLIQDLAECRDKALVGGKAINLGQLIRAGFPVPGGFVITTEAYGRFARTQAHALPVELAEQVKALWGALGQVPVAVRSSATAEDMADASMAGQYETFLDISDEPSLQKAILDCWASLDTPRTRAYLAEHSIDLAHVAMAVVVQKLVPADVSGVMFTANPQTGSRKEMLIEASWGLGEAIVSGLVQPDVLRIDADSARVVHATISDKLIWIPPGQRQHQAVEESRRNVRCLGSGDVTGLWQLGRRAVEYFGGPQDMEWAIHDGQLYLLQSRPITTLAHAEAYEQILQSTRAQLRARLDGGRGPWVLHNISETLKHPTPLTWSVVRQFMSGSGGFGAMYRQAGFEPSAKVADEGFLELIAGRAYMDLSLASEMFFADYPFRYDPEALRSNPDAGQSPPTVPAGSLSARIKAGRRVGAVNQKLRQISADFDKQITEQIIPPFVEYCRQEKAQDLAKLPTGALIQLWQERTKRVMDEFAPQSLLPSMIAAMALGDLRAFLDENFWDEDPDALANLLATAHAPDKTLLANAGLFELAAGTRSASQWLADYGHRAPDEFDLATPRWREQEEELLQFADRLKGGVNPLDLHHRHHESARAKSDELRAALGPAEAAELERLVNFARRYLPFREDGKYYLMLGYDLLRDIALEAGRRLEIGDDVFQLSLQELIDALHVGFAPLHMIAQRKIAFDAEGRVYLPPLIDADAIANLGQAPTLSTASTHPAFAVSPGVATGPARVVHSPKDAPDLGRGYILVCPSTDPGWTPLFINAAGLILECGGTLSHGAVIAREMNIPAVILRGATELFEDGETIIVDGRNGSVSRPASDASAADAPPQPAPTDTRIPRELVPPVPGKGERASAKLRNISLLIWGVYLLAAFLLPENWLYNPTMALFDRLLWPLVRAVGRPCTVAIIAAVMAAATMIGQLLLTDNSRLREAKRRAAMLNKQADALPKGSPRRLAMFGLADPVQIRVAMAALVPLAALLGPMMMIFAWLPLRMDVAAVNADPGAGGQIIFITATANSDLRKPITLSLDPNLSLKDECPATQNLLPIRQTLDDLAHKWEQLASTHAAPAELQIIARLREQLVSASLLADLKSYLDKGLPPQTLVWKVLARPGAVGRFSVSISTPGADPLTAHVVLGNRHPLEPAEISAPPNRPLQSLKIDYPKPKLKPHFGSLASVGLPHWDPGWLLTYLAIYLPCMFAVRWMLKVV